MPHDGAAPVSLCGNYEGAIKAGKGMKKYKLVLDCPDKGVIQFDIRGKSGAIGHLVLTETGLAWKPKGKQKISGSEIPWDKVSGGISSWSKASQTV